MSDDGDLVLPVYVLRPPPRFMTDEQLRAHFGLSERALRVCRAMREFPRRNAVVYKTDSKLVDRFFDRMSGLDGESIVDDGEEFLSGSYARRRENPAGKGAILRMRFQSP